MDTLNKLTIGLLVLLFSSLAHSNDLSDLEIYSKCHLTISDYPIDLDSAITKKVENGELDPVDACMSLFDKAKLVAKNNKRMLSNTQDSVAISILRKFNQFHRSWFTSYGEFGSTPARALFNYMDYDEPALFITDSLFSNKHYKTIVTRNDSVRGVREGMASSRYYVDTLNTANRTIIAGPLEGGNNVNRLSESEINARIQMFDFPKVDLGYLVGIEPTPTMTIQKKSNFKTDKYQSSLASSFQSEGDTYNIGQHYGGGILGSTAYLFFNSENNGRLDGGVRVHRRMANNTFFDLMCLPMPNLKDSDINQYMQKYSSSDLSFRQDRSCAKCHATLDPFAHAFRNHLVLDTSVNAFQRNVRAKTGDNHIDMKFIKKFPVRIQSQVTVDSDNSYHRRTPAGQLYYRNYNGVLVNRAVNGIADLGNKIAAQDDIYMCAAQRYYTLLTGITIDVAVQQDDEFYKKHRAEIVNFGKQLKSHGSLKQLIKSIFQSKAFQSKSPGFISSSGGE